MSSLKKPESEKKQKVIVSMNPKVVQALNYFSEMVHLPKSLIVNIALSQYLKRNNSKAKKLLKNMNCLTITIDD
jgi:hypothetical protein